MIEKVFFRNRERVYESKALSFIYLVYRALLPLLGMFTIAVIVVLYSNELFDNSGSLLVCGAILAELFYFHVPPQWRNNILTAFASANVHAMVLGVDIANLQVERFGQAKAQRISDENEDPVSKLTGLQDELTNLSHTQYSRKRLDFGCFDDIYPLPIAL